MEQKDEHDDENVNAIANVNCLHGVGGRGEVGRGGDRRAIILELHFAKWYACDTYAQKKTIKVCRAPERKLNADYITIYART